MEINILRARIYFWFSLMVYMIVGAYIDSLDLTGHTDPILAMIPVVDVSTAATCGLVFLYAAALVCLKPLMGTEKEAEFWMIIASTLIVRMVLCIAAGFGPPDGYFVIVNGEGYIETWLRKCYLLFRYDFFFSGHTAAPFLFFLFFEGGVVKAIFLTGTVLMAISVLLLHYHYVIDVAAAPFIVGAVYIFHKRGAK